ncbi:MAG: metallophosphoesterase family protein [Bacilli bacterium]
MYNIKYDLYDDIIKLIISGKSIDEIVNILSFDIGFIKNTIKKLKSNIINESKEELFFIVPQINKLFNSDISYPIDYRLLKLINNTDEYIMRILGLNSKAYLVALKSLYFNIYVYGSNDEKKYLTTVKDKINKLKYIDDSNRVTKNLIINHDKCIVLANGMLHTLDSEFGNLYSFNKRKFIVISDTHFGSLFENMGYLDSVYEYASKNNVDCIVHTGDLIEGSYSNYSRCKNEYKNYMAQVDHVLKDYCYDKKINNYILLGNHDLYPFIDYEVDISELLCSRCDFIVLGYKEAYLSLFDDYITLKHDVSKIKNVPKNHSTLLNFSGHSHQYRCTYDRNNIYIKVPTLSDVYNNRTYVINKGFIVVDVNEDNICIDYIDTFGKSLKLERRLK